MDSDRYFKIVSEFGNVIHIQPQGHWNNETADRFAAALKEKFKRAVDEMHAKGRKFIVLANMSDFHIEGEKTRELLTELMKTSVSNEFFYRTVQVMPDPATRKEIQVSAEKAGQSNVRFVVGTLEDANAKILELKKELIRI